MVKAVIRNIFPGSLYYCFASEYEPVTCIDRRKIVIETNIAIVGNSKVLRYCVLKLIHPDQCLYWSHLYSGSPW